MKALDFDPRDEGFNLFKQTAERFNEQRYFNGYYNGRYDEFDIKGMIFDLDHSANRIKLEIEKIDKCKDAFFRSFASNDTEKFRNRIDIPKATKLAAKTFLKIVQDSTKKPKKRPGQVSVFDKNQSRIYYSSVTSDYYQTSTDSLSDIPSYHQQLFKVIRRCLNLVDKMIETCKQLLKEENEWRNDPDRLRDILDNQVQDFRHRIIDESDFDLYGSIAAYKDKPDPIYEALQKSKSMEEFLTNYYHVFNLKNMHTFVVCMLIREAKGNDRKDAIQKLIPQKNRDNVNFVLDNIESFRDFIPKKKNASKIARFFIWTKATNISGFYDLFCDLNLGVDMADYAYLTTVIKKQKGQSEKQFEEYCSNLEAKIRNLRNISAKNAANTAVKYSLQSK